ncbi:MAG: hypothetical protein AAFW83_09315 [Pseudomonadota bacterium]
MIARMLNDHMIKVVSLIVLTSLVVQALVGGTLGAVGSDSDDMMRLLQVRDFFNGQSWFDLHQYRLGSDGTLMHWSRVPDLPLIVLIAVADLFLPYEQAEIVGYSVWPLLCAVLVAFGLITAARRVGGTALVGVTAILTIAFLFKHFRFAPGAIDHHNLQLALLAIAIGGLVDPLRRRWSFAMAGAALGLTFTIGMEIYVFSAVLCAGAACLWAFLGDDVVPAVRAFGLAFAGTLAIIFVGTVAPQNYLAVYCDAYSSIILGAGLVAGVGLAALSTLVKGSQVVRFGALAGLGAVCLILILAAAPQCLSNPLAALPDDAKHLWLDNVKEAKPLWALPESPFVLAPYMLGVQFLALGLSGYQVWRRRDVAFNGLFTALMAATILFTVYQARFLHFGFLFSILPLAVWVARFYERARETGGDRSGAILALGASLPLVWALPFGIIETSFASEDENPVYDIEDLAGIKGCYGPAIIGALNELPAGLIAAAPNAAPALLSETQHRVLTGNYHRNVDGIVDGIRVFTYPPEKAAARLRANGVDYMLFCYPSNFMRFLEREYEDGLVAYLARGDVPDFLELAANPQIMDEGRTETVQLYRVVTP